MAETLPLNNDQEQKQYEKKMINGKKIYTCLISECSKKFKFKSEIKRHLTTHSNQRPFTCSFPSCSKSFKRADALQSHMTIHTGKVILSCPVQKCGSQFNTKSALQYHLLKHKGEKVYKCSQPGCYKSFLTFSHLKQHESAVGFHQKLQLTTDPANPFFSHLQFFNSAEAMTDSSVPQEKAEDNYFRSDYNGLNNYKTLDPIKFEEETKPSVLDGQRLHHKSKDSFNPFEIFQKNNETSMKSINQGLDSYSKNSLFDVFVLLKKENDELEKKIKINLDLLQNNLTKSSSSQRNHSDVSKNLDTSIQTKVE